jgi:K+-sensing histidine kinase KdpD
LPKKPSSLASGRQNHLRDLIAPILLSIAAVLFTSILLVEVHSHLTALHMWRDPEDLAVAYILPTIFITVIFGSNIGVWSAFTSGLAAAYFVYPPQFSFAIDDPKQLVELGFLVALWVTASKSTAVLADEKPLNRRPREAARPHSYAITSANFFQNTLSTLHRGRSAQRPRHKVGCS